MKVLYLFSLLCILGVCAQRRSANGEDLETSSHRPASRSRGRTRFSVTPEFEQISPEYEEVTKNIRKTDTPRRKSEHAKPTEKRIPARPKESGPKGRPYEVKEVIDDIPRDDSRRPNKRPRVVTESRFEAVNAPKKDLFTPALVAPEEIPLESFATPSVPESIADETAIPAQLTTLPMNTFISTEKSTEFDSKNIDAVPLDIPGASENPIDTELQRKHSTVAAPVPFRKSQESRRASQGRSSSRTRGTTAASAAAEEPVTPGARIRVRPKPARKQEEPSVPIVPSSPRSSFRAGRRRAESVAESVQEPVRTRGPSVFSAENGQELPSRSRTGRKVSSASERRVEQRNGSEETRTTARSRGARPGSSRRTSQASTTVSAPEKVDLIQTRRDSSRTTHAPVSTSADLPEKVEFISTRRDGGSRITQSTTTASVALPEKLELISTRRESSRPTSSTTAASANDPEKIELIPTPRDSGRTTSSTTGVSPSVTEKIELISTRRAGKSRASQSTSTASVPDRSTSARRESRRGSRVTEPTVEKSSSSRISNRERTTQASESRSQKRVPSRGTHERGESTTHHIERQSRGRARTRSFLTLNEQQLEVLPLFEIEPKTVVHTPDSATVPSRSSLGRRRSLNAAEDIDIASTKQTEVKLEVDPVKEKPASSTQSSIKVSRQESISVETKTEKAIRKVNKKRPTSPRTKPTLKHLPRSVDSKENQVKESVSVSEVTEVTLTRKFVPHNNRKNKVADSSRENASKDDQIKPSGSDAKKTVKVDEPKVSFRQVVRKATQKLPTKSKEKTSGELTNSQEDIGDTDNYPAPFKAAIQAKKSKKGGLGSRSSEAGEVSITKTTEKAVTSSTASSALESSPSSKPADVENVVNGDEEIDHKSEPESTTLAPSAKFPRPRFSLTTKLPKASENPSEAAGKAGSARPAFPRKYKPGKSKPATTTTTQGSTDSGEDAATTPTPLQKFHARFKSRNQKDVVVTPRPAHKSRSYSPKAPKGVYSSRKFARSSTTAPDAVAETEKPKPRKFSIETSALSTKIPPTGQGIKKSSRFSSRYRSDILSRSAAHRTSTTVPAYVPTVPTVTPPPTSVKVEENELGMEVISFDDPVANTVPSANLINGDYLSSSTDKTESSTPSTKTDPTSVVTMNANSESAKVTITEINSFAKESKDTAAHTTEKPVSIIERIINSITAISTTAPPDSATKTSTTNGQSTKSSAILNLVSKRPKDKTLDLTIEPSAQKHTRSPNSVDYRTTEKPTTIIEKILSSLSAIRADTAADSTTIDPMQADVAQNTVPSSVEANLLSLNGVVRTTTQIPLPTLTELLGGRTVSAFNSLLNRTNGDGQTPKVQTLEVDPLTNKVRLETLPHKGNIVFRWKPVTRRNFTPVKTQIRSRVNVENVELNTISSASSPPSPTPAPAPPASSTKAPSTTPVPLPLSSSSPAPSTTAIPITTLLSSTNPPGPPSTTALPSTTFFPTFLTTLFSTLQPEVRVTTTVPTTVVPTTTYQAPPTVTTTFAPVTTTFIPAATTPALVTTTFAPATTASAPVTTTSRVLYTSPVSRSLSASPNALSLDVTEGKPTPVPSTTLLDLLSRGAASTTPLPTTLISTTIGSLNDINLKQRKLTEQQKQDLATLEALEKEQNAILQQLAFLTGLNVGNVAPPKGNDNLADRVLSMAMNRFKGLDKGFTNTNAPPVNLLETLLPKDSRQSKSVAVPSVEDIVKQINANGLNSVTPSGPIVAATYGKTNEALLASLLKEYGVGPTTPEALSGAFIKEVRSTTSAPKVTTTTKRPTTTTQAPGRFMQGLNWLLNALAPPPTKRPQPKPKPNPLAIDEEELLNKQPTEINSVVVQPDESKTDTSGISQEQLVTLIKQLEDIQKDPKKAQGLDIEALKTLQNVQANGKSAGIQVINTSSTGATSRTFVTTTGSPSTRSAVTDNDIKPLIVNRGGTGKATTVASVGVSNSILDDVELAPRGTASSVALKEVPGVAADLEAATTKTKIPPVKLNPVPGVPDENPRIRGQLVNYAINVTKAISSFLGNALQGAASSFQSLIGSGTRTAGNYRNSDSANRPG